MKTLFCAIALFAFAYTCSAQTDSTKKQNTTSKADSTGNLKNADGAFSKVEIESEFPGGSQGWASFLQQNLTYPGKAVRKRIEGTVILQFIVCTDGTVCNIEAVSGPEELRKSAIEALKKTPNWEPAVQDGKNVKSYKKQPIVYRLQRG
jgi:periplasmic protein TonB